ncbi:MAG TPA: condensation domain-containing protein [Ktedonobacteraceae bacterium]|nr:condensation domain-containing protein [Ktedonobacteraceae bacterium]
MRNSWVCDHLIGDGISLAIAVNEVQTAYAALRSGEPIVLPEAGSYLDFGTLQRERYARLHAHSPELGFWRSFMAGQQGRFFPRLPLSFGVKDGELDYPSANETIQLLDHEQSTRFESLCRQYQATFFIGLLATVAIALREMSDIQEYRAVMPIAERKDPRWASAFGWFVNTMPIQFAVAGKHFAEVLAAAKTGFAESLASVDVPLVKAWKYLEPDTYRQRSWPYPVNFFSFLDFRKMPGAEQYRIWSPNTIVHLSHCNGGSIWLYRNDDGTFLHTVFAQTTLARQSMNTYRKTIRQVLCDLIEEPNRTAMNLSFSEEFVIT